MLEDLKPLFKIFYTFVCKKVPGKITDKYLYNDVNAMRTVIGRCP